MSAQEWNDEMLHRLAGTVETSARITENSERIMQALAAGEAEAREERQRFLQFIAKKQEIFAQMQVEIDALRAEANRKLDILSERRCEGGDKPDA